MNEVILAKYGELILKGSNRSSFEAMLLREVRRRAKPLGAFTVAYRQSTVYVIPEDDDARDHIDAMLDEMKHVFGFAGLCRAAECEKTLDAILDTARNYLPPFLEDAKTFRCEAKRSDKRFPMKSPELAGEVGGAILELCPHLRVDLDNPDITVRIEVRDQAAYIHAGQLPGAGGSPTVRPVRDCCCSPAGSTPRSPVSA